MTKLLMTILEIFVTPWEIMVLWGVLGHSIGYWHSMAFTVMITALLSTPVYAGVLAAKRVHGD